MKQLFELLKDRYRRVAQAIASCQIQRRPEVTGLLFGL